MSKSVNHQCKHGNTFTRHILDHMMTIESKRTTKKVQVGKRNPKYPSAYFATSPSQFFSSTFRPGITELCMHQMICGLRGVQKENHTDTLCSTFYQYIQPSAKQNPAIVTNKNRHFSKYLQWPTKQEDLYYHHYIYKLKLHQQLLCTCMLTMAPIWLPRGRL